MIVTPMQHPDYGLYHRRFPGCLLYTSIYGSAKNNWMSTDWQKPTETITPLLDCIIENLSLIHI